MCHQQLPTWRDRQLYRYGVTGSSRGSGTPTNTAAPHQRTRPGPGHTHHFQHPVRCRCVPRVCKGDESRQAGQARDHGRGHGRAGSTRRHTPANGGGVRSGAGAGACGWAPCAPPARLLVPGRRRPSTGDRAPEQRVGGASSSQRCRARERWQQQRWGRRVPGPGRLVGQGWLALAGPRGRVPCQRGWRSSRARRAHPRARTRRVRARGRLQQRAGAPVPRPHARGPARHCPLLRRARQGGEAARAPPPTPASTSSKVRSPLPCRVTPPPHRAPAP